MGNISDTYGNELGPDEITDKVESLRKDALPILNKSLKDHGMPSPAVSDEELNTFLLQIKHNMVLVAVVGEGSCGKSTLLNTFLRDYFLPTGCRRDTAIRVYIGHDANVHKGRCTNPSGTCPKCPVLCSGFDKNSTELCRGVKNIKAKIDEINQLVDNQQTDKTFLVLYTYLSVFEFVDETDQLLKPFFVDSPGVEDFRDDVKLFYNIESSLMYIENYTRFLQKKQKIKKELELKPESANLLFVVTYFDHYFTSRRENNPDETSVRNDVASTFTDVNENDVYPVSGHWAFNALISKIDQNDVIAKETVNDACMYYKRRRNLPQEDSETDAVIEISGFNELERRLSKSIQNTDIDMWRINIYTQCKEFLERCIVPGEQLLEKIRNEKQSLDRSNTVSERKLKWANEYRQDFFHFCTDEKLKSVTRDIIKNESFTSNAMPAVNIVLNEFFNTCKNKVEEQVYKFQNFEEDLQKFTQSTFNSALKNCLSLEANSCFSELKVEIHRKYQKFISCIDLEAEEVAFAEKFHIKLSELKGFQPSFGNYGDSIRDRARSCRRWNWGKAGISGLTGAGITGGLFGISASSIIVMTLPVAAIAAPIGVGLLGGLYYSYRAMTTYDSDTILKVQDIENICTQLMDDKLTAILSTCFSSEEERLHMALLENVKELAAELKKNYLKNWKQKYKKLEEDLKENKRRLKTLREEESNLEKFTQELQEYHSFLVQRLESMRIDANTMNEYDIIMT